jgi:hypothetical protein
LAFRQALRFRENFREVFFQHVDDEEFPANEAAFFAFVHVGVGRQAAPALRAIVFVQAAAVVQVFQKRFG